MSISYYDQFTGIDWERYGTISGQVTAGSCLLLSIVSMILGGKVAIGIYTLFVGLFISIWELPQMYVCIPQAPQARNLFENNLQLKRPSVRAVVYILISTYTFVGNSLCVAAGILLIISSILYLFAAINRRSDDNDGLTDGMTTDEERGDGGSYKSVVFPGVASAAVTAGVDSKLLGSNKFGTF